LGFEHIAQGEQADQSLIQQRMLHPLSYPFSILQWTWNDPYSITPTAKWQICILTNQLLMLLCWFHEVLGHFGIHRLCNTIATHCSHPQLRATVNDVIKHCGACQINKLTGPGYGHLLSHKATSLPFQEVAVDLIGPWHVTLSTKYTNSMLSLVLI
jgi:hypothetical protein